jgi:hypothetical protein
LTAPAIGYPGYPKNALLTLTFGNAVTSRNGLSISPTPWARTCYFSGREFDGFEETRERLDLLAVDKKGNLVVIENKLDDSGRDVTWQALKYAAYVSTLKMVEIVELYQKYLNRHYEGDSAESWICEFLEIEELQEAKSNPSSGYRIILIAANFRRGVIATVLWLIGRGIAMQCFRATPFGFENELFSTCSRSPRHPKLQII